MRTNKSYARRQGRMMADQKRALSELWDKYGVLEEGVLDLDTVFGRQAPRHLEIGFGMGDALLELAKSHPENDYLGVDVHLPGVGQLMLRLEAIGLTNVRIDRRDAVEVLQYLPAQSIERLYLFFPDPWLKRRHRKRRLVQLEFVEKMKRVLTSGGVFHAATDWHDYARHIMKVMEAAEGFVNCAGPDSFSTRPEGRPVTKFELRGLSRGHEVSDILYERV